MSSFLAIIRKPNGLFMAFLREQIPGTEKEASSNREGEKFVFVASTTPQAIKHAENYIDGHDFVKGGYVFIERLPGGAKTEQP